MPLSISRTNPYTAPDVYQLKQEDFFALTAPYSISGNIVDIINKRIFSGTIYVNGLGDIERIEERDVPELHYILPPFVDSHIHIESTMMVPSEYARVGVRHGVVTAICDPHEIANVMGEAGIQYMIENGKKTPFKFFFGAPSCVPAAPYETSGAVLNAAEIEKLMASADIYFLGEMMNFPDVINRNPEVMAKINAAKKYHKPIDGHAPGLRGEMIRRYAAGISTDHECMTLAEAEEKLALGMKILIREGSAAKNFEALFPLIDKYPDLVMLCTDDTHPDDLQAGYINTLVKRALGKKLNLFNVLKAASINPVIHYKLPVGLLNVGDPADFIIVDNPDDLNILQTFINGKIVYNKGEVEFLQAAIEPINNFQAAAIKTDDITVIKTRDKIQVIEIIDKELYTKALIVTPKVLDNKVVPDIENDILKIVVLNRYIADAKPAVGFVKNFGLKKGAICSTVAHDSHNIIAVGTDDKSIVKVINAVIGSKGGIVAFDGKDMQLMPLPVAGIMSDKSVGEVAGQYKVLHNMAKEMGSQLTAPFMILAFMALIVIPELKICDKGLFDVVNFEPVDLFI
ncbi:MAG: adenine deaminase [Prevotellaceae bacterium]|jgi:adenine deaminase|nr:adenine deaminase [Prevotellaceae bacterium]